ncbi:hypothetical protein [Rhizobium sp. MHM7A]|uniref:hypothetical protein n=1 Tax=Rhizobium sp. MHM7A TaxID=2583233 RepID=UPI001105DBFC|nr:hypothetical protein [Rhizobium sp. MHM7A]TLX15815.1 hypothetical protein FFR93_00435 [Rhizobium sp. MHM7A]
MDFLFNREVVMFTNVSGKSSFALKARIAGVACLAIAGIQSWALMSNTNSAGIFRYSSDEEITAECKDYAWSVGRDGIYRTINPAMWFKTWCAPYSAKIRKVDMDAYSARLRETIAKVDAEEQADKPSK